MALDLSPTQMTLVFSESSFSSFLMARETVVWTAPHSPLSDVTAISSFSGFASSRGATSDFS